MSNHQLISTLEEVFNSSQYSLDNRSKALDILKSKKIFAYTESRVEYATYIHFFLKSLLSNEITRISYSKQKGLKNAEISITQNYDKASFEEVKRYGNMKFINFNFKKDFCLKNLNNFINIQKI